MRPNEHPDGSRRDPAPSRPMPPKRESDRLLARLRTLVDESRRGRGANSVELKARDPESPPSGASFTPIRFLRPPTGRHAECPAPARGDSVTAAQVRSPDHLE
jgi:hypothetical protein